MREMGSEFWTPRKNDAVEDTPPWHIWRGDKLFLVSGRTALDAIITDILADRACKTAYLPSYCCHTMIEPFIKHGIDVDFYPVVFNNNRLHINIDEEMHHDITLVMDYFGFTGYAPVEVGNTIVIRDLTHSLLADAQAMLSGDYLFASFRKWDAIAGAAVACKTVGKFAVRCTKQHARYIDMRNKAYTLKASYIEGNEIDKKEFLDLFGEAEILLANNYTGYAADSNALNVSGRLGRCVNIRRSNAELLLTGLYGISFLSPMFSEMKACDAPLFVPVVVENGLRDTLRKYLIDNGIYCPVHWPLTQMHSILPDERRVYDGELSLLCDQRYNAADMKTQLDYINRFGQINA